MSASAKNKKCQCLIHLFIHPFHVYWTPNIKQAFCSGEICGHNMKIPCFQGFTVTWEIGYAVVNILCVCTLCQAQFSTFYRLLTHLSLTTAI